MTAAAIVAYWEAGSVTLPYKRDYFPGAHHFDTFRYGSPRGSAGSSRLSRCCIVGRIVLPLRRAQG